MVHDVQQDVQFGGVGEGGWLRRCGVLRCFLVTAKDDKRGLEALLGNLAMVCEVIGIDELLPTIPSFSLPFAHMALILSLMHTTS